MKFRRRFFYGLFLVPYYFCFLSVYSQDITISKKDTSEVRFINQRKFFIYKVDKGETLYSIANKFKIPQEEINEFNPELKDGLKVKMKLWIPASSLLKKEEVVTVPTDKHHEQQVYNIALISSFNIPQSYSVDPSLVDSNFISSLSEETVTNLEFYEGILIAMDSLKKNKLKVHLHLFDDEHDSLKTASLMKNPEMKKMDLIISNGNSVSTKLINAFSGTNHIRFASFTMNSVDMIKDNRNAIAFYTSSLTQCREMGKIAAEKFRQVNGIVLKTLVNKENDRSNAFLRGWSEVSENKLKEADYALTFKKFKKDSIEDYLKSVKEMMEPKQNNLIFVPSSNEEFVSTLVNSLKEISEQYHITLIGLPTWQHFETIDPLLFELLDTHIFTSSSINYNSPSSISFRKKFYDSYVIEPIDGAYQGFDLMMVMGNELLGNEQKPEDHLTEKIFPGIFTSYKFRKVPENSFLENHYITVCKFRNNELKKIND